MKKNILLIGLCCAIYSVDAMYARRPTIDTKRLDLSSPEKYDLSGYDFSLKKPTVSQPLNYSTTVVTPQQKPSVSSTNPYSLTNPSAAKAPGLASVKPVATSSASAQKVQAVPSVKPSFSQEPVKSVVKPVIVAPVKKGSPVVLPKGRLDTVAQSNNASKGLAIATASASKSKDTLVAAQHKTFTRELSDEVKLGLAKAKTSAVDIFKEQVTDVITAEMNQIKKEMRKEIAGMIVYTMRVLLPGLIKDAVNGIIYGVSSIGSGLKNMVVGGPEKASNREKGFFEENENEEVDIVL